MIALAQLIYVNITLSNTPSSSLSSTGLISIGIAIISVLAAFFESWMNARISRKQRNVDLKDQKLLILRWCEARLGELTQISTQEFVENILNEDEMLKKVRFFFGNRSFDEFMKLYRYEPIPEKSLLLLPPKNDFDGDKYYNLNSIYEQFIRVSDKIPDFCHFREKAKTVIGVTERDIAYYRLKFEEYLIIMRKGEEITNRSRKWIEDIRNEISQGIR